MIASSSGPPLAEFALLLGILTNLSAVKTAIIDSGLVRTRAQLDARIPRDSIWSTTVAPAFNDPSIVPSIPSIETWTDKLGEAFRVARAPVFPRQGSELKRWYVDCRAAFTQYYNRWNRSGPNFLESFHDFVPHHSGGILAM
jgi:hypothetical protein